MNKSLNNDLMYLCDLIDPKFADIYNVRDDEKKYLIQLSKEDLIIERDQCIARIKEIEGNKLRYVLEERRTRNVLLQMYLDELKKMEYICKIITFKWEIREDYCRKRMRYDAKQFYQECELLLYLIDTNRYLSYLDIIFYFESMSAVSAIEYLLNLKIIKCERKPKKLYDYFWVIDEEKKREFEEMGEMPIA